MNREQLTRKLFACSLRSTKLTPPCPDHIAPHAIVGFGHRVNAVIRIATEPRGGFSTDNVSF